MKRIIVILLLAAGVLPGAAPAQEQFYSQPLDADPGWTTESDWAFGVPAGQGGCAPHPTPSPGLCTESWGYPDPSSGYSGNNVYGYNLNGDYPLNLPQTYYLTTASINCHGYRSVSLKFRRWLNVERSINDLANIQASSDGVSWINFWTNPGDSGKPVTDYSWGISEHAIGSVADNQAAVRIRWGLGPTDNQYTCSGWNIDDIELWGIPIPSPTVSPVPTASPTPTATPTLSPTPTASPSPSITPTATPYGYKSPTPSITPPPTATPTLSPVPTATPTPTASPTLTPTPSVTPSPSTTPTPSVTPTMIPTATPIPTPSPGVPVRIYSFHLDSDPGWTTESAWAFGRPRGGGEIIGDEGIDVFYPNPTYANTGIYVYGFNLAGGYGAGMPPYSLTTKPIDCSALVKTRLVFYRWLNIERSGLDSASVRVSANGSSWTTVWENPAGDWVRDSSWLRHEFDISSVADHRGSVYLRWVMGPTDGDVSASGWNLDDVEIWAVPPGPTPIPTSTPVPTPRFPFPLLDYNGDGTSDLAIYRAASGLWAVRGVTRAYFGAGTDNPVPGDYSGDGTAKIAIYRGSSGLWAIRKLTRLYFGGSGDRPRPAAWSGEGKIDIAVFRRSSGLWAVRGLTRFYFGAAADIPIEGYYAGLPAAAGIFRAASGLWAIRGVTRLYFGRPDDLPQPADYNGLRCWQPAIFRPASGLWAIKGAPRVYFGGTEDRPVPAEYGGRWTDRVAIFRPAAGLWAIRKLTRAYFGGSQDLPVSR